MQDGMEKALLKLAKQLEALDEASLMSLWSKYATLCTRFEPTARWEEAALVFSLIQAKRWKNQLFNYCWRKQQQPENAQATTPAGAEAHGFTLERKTEESKPAPQKPCRVLSFQPLLSETEGLPANITTESTKKSRSKKAQKTSPKNTFPTSDKV